jgi:hypothetical protein
LLSDFGPSATSTGFLLEQPKQQNLIPDDLLGSTTYNQTSDLFQQPKQPTVNYALESLGGFDGLNFGGVM